MLREYVSGAPEKFLTTHHERDVETGLDYRGARFYDSDVGRFLSLDPLAADFASWSPYNYVVGNPVSYIDPDGRYVRGDKTTSLASFIKVLLLWEIEAAKYRRITWRGNSSSRESLNHAKIRIFDADFRATKQIVNTVGGNKKFSYNKSFGKYVNLGLPLDVSHFFKMASLAQDNPDWLVRFAYVHEEQKQAYDPRPAGRTSAFAPEDLFSNELGVIFASSLSSEDEFSTELASFFREIQTLFTTNKLGNGKYLTNDKIERLRGIAKKYYGTEDLTTFQKDSDIYKLENIRLVHH